MARPSCLESDYRALVDLQKLARELGITIIVLTHTRKLETDEKFDAISGTLGLAGAADTLMILAAGPGGMTLNIKGRDVEETEHAVAFSGTSCRWTLLGSAAEVHRSDTRKTILAALLKATEPMGPQEISLATGIGAATVRQRLHQMVPDGEVTKFAHGKYCHPARLDLIHTATP